MMLPIFLNEYFERTRHPIFTDDNVLDRFICGEGNTPATDTGRANSLNGSLASLMHYSQRHKRIC